MGEKKKVRWVYCGKRVHHNGDKKELFSAYVEFVDHLMLVNGEVAGLKYYGASMGSSKRGSDVVGGIYEGEVSTDENGREVAHNVGRWEYKGTYPNLDLRTSLRALSDAAVAIHDAWKRKKEDAADDPILSALEPIRKAYKATNTVGKRALMAKVMEYLSR